MARCASRLPTAPGASGRCATRARPPFALDRLRELDRKHLAYVPPKAGPGGSTPHCRTPLERLDRLTALASPPGLHRHPYFGVLAPNAPLRTSVTALAPDATVAPPPPPRSLPPNRRTVAAPAMPGLKLHLAVGSRN